MKRRLPFLLVFSLLWHCGEDTPNKQTSSEKIPSTATVTFDGLKVRMGPNTLSSEIGRLSENTRVDILTRSVEEVKIGKMQAHWYQIKTESGLKGWVYGAYLSIAPGAKEAQEADRQKKEKKLRDMLLGRWYATNKSGSLKTLFVTFFSNDIFEMGFRKQVYTIGEYTLRFKGNRVYIDLVDVKKPQVTELYGELRGATFSVRGLYRNSEYTFTLTDKGAKSYNHSRHNRLAKKLNKKLQAKEKKEDE